MESRVHLTTTTYPYSRDIDGGKVTGTVTETVTVQYTFDEPSLTGTDQEETVTIDDNWKGSGWFVGADNGILSGTVTESGEAHTVLHHSLTSGQDADSNLTITDSRSLDVTGGGSVTTNFSINDPADGLTGSGTITDNPSSESHNSHNWTVVYDSGVLTSGSGYGSDNNSDSDTYDGSVTFTQSLGDGVASGGSISAKDSIDGSANVKNWFNTNGSITNGIWVTTGSGGSSSSGNASDTLSNVTGSYWRLVNADWSDGTMRIGGSISGSATGDLNFGFGTTSTLNADGSYTYTGSGTSHTWGLSDFSFSGGGSAGSTIYLSDPNDPLYNGSRTYQESLTEGGSFHDAPDTLTTWTLDPNGQWRSSSTTSSDDATIAGNFIFDFTGSGQDTDGAANDDGSGSDSFSEFSDTDHITQQFQYHFGGSKTDATDIDGNVTTTGAGAGGGSDSGLRTHNGETDWFSDSWDSSGSTTSSDSGDSAVTGRETFVYGGNWSQDYVTGLLTAFGTNAVQGHASWYSETDGSYTSGVANYSASMGGPGFAPNFENVVYGTATPPAVSFLTDPGPSFGQNFSTGISGSGLQPGLATAPSSIMPFTPAKPQLIPGYVNGFGVPLHQLIIGENQNGEPIYGDWLLPDGSPLPSDWTVQWYNGDAYGNPPPPDDPAYNPGAQPKPSWGYKAVAYTAIGVIGAGLLPEATLLTVFVGGDIGLITACVDRVLGGE